MSYQIHRWQWIAEALVGLALSLALGVLLVRGAARLLQGWRIIIAPVEECRPARAVPPHAMSLNPFLPTE